MPTYDVLTLGETMLRLTPPQLQRIAQATVLEMHIGGSESNTAVGLAALGLRVGWLSRVTNNALGQYVVQGLRRYGVDTSQVVWTEDQRLGLYFLEEGKAPRTSRVIYDRADSAVCFMQPSDLPQQLDTRLVHLTGITLAINERTAETARHMLRMAQDEGAFISFDTNYRANLCSADSARTDCDHFMQAAHIILMPLKDANQFYGTASPEAHLEHLASAYPQAVVVMTLGKEGVLCHARGYGLFHQPAFMTETVGRVGGGDSLTTGFLYGYLQNQDDLALALRWGAACAAFKYTMPGDMPLLNVDEVAMLVHGDDQLTDIRR